MSDFGDTHTLLDEVLRVGATMGSWVDAEVPERPQSWVALCHAHLRRADMAVARTEGFPATRWSHPDDSYREQLLRTAAICIAAVARHDGAA